MDEGCLAPGLSPLSVNLDLYMEVQFAKLQKTVAVLQAEVNTLAQRVHILENPPPPTPAPAPEKKRKRVRVQAKAPAADTPKVEDSGQD